MKYDYSGLSHADVEKSRELHGANDLSLVKGQSFLDKLRENFRNPIIIILNIALVIILVLSFFEQSEWYEALAIGVAVLLAVFVSTFSEFKNESSFQNLQEEASKIICNVFRDGKITQILINDIVKGDYVLLQSGDKVPADGILINGELKVNQASLTGESEEIIKTPADVDYKLAQNDFNDPHYLFRGSVVDDGEAVIVVDTVGSESFYGKLAKELSIVSERPSPLQVKLKDLAHMISIFGYVGAVLIAVSYMFNHIVLLNNFDPQLISQYFNDWQLFTEDLLNAVVLAIIIVVAAVPEGLPMMIAIVLSLNMRKMLREKVLVRKLLGIETAGSLDILFSDKTGTITTGQLEPQYILNGEYKYNSYAEIPDKLKSIIRCAILGNTYCVITPDGEAIGGNISERALINFIDRQDRQSDDTEAETVNTIRFDSAKKFSATEVKNHSAFADLFGTDQVTFVKGAVEINLENTGKYVDENGELKTLTLSKELLETSDKLAAEGVRLIAIAYSESHIPDDKSLPENLNLIGVIGIHDDIRHESYTAVKNAMAAGIQVVMITGDRKGTAEAIAKEIGLIEGENDLILTSEELNKYSDDELKKILPNLKIVARALPTDKSRLVRIAKSQHRVVGMTGDGVNDSAALKQADVGFAMGSGSEVAKEAGDIVILDDNFSSITNAVRYGRTIFKSIRKFIIFQLTVNIAAVLTVFLSPFFGMDLPLTIIQLLWINIIMDTLAAIAFGGEPALTRVMREKPVRRDENIVSRYMSSAILTIGIYITALSIFFLSFPPMKEFFIRDGVPNTEIFLSAFFNLFILMIIFNSFNARTEKLNLLDNITKNTMFLKIISLILVLQVIFTYIGGTILRTAPLNPREWLFVVLLALSVIPVDLIRKWVLLNFSNQKVGV